MPISASSKAGRLTEDHRPERERMHMVLIADAQRGLADIAAGRTVEADTAIAKHQQQRTAARQGDQRPIRGHLDRE